MGWQPGETVLGLYEVKDVRSGGMGVVHRVRHLDWQVDLAVKTPHPEWITTAADRRHFEREAGTWVNLGLHPNTVNCVYVRTIGEVPRVFAEWVDGGSLAEAVRQGNLTPARILDVAIQTAWGLAHAHEAGLVHQDVKPANVMLDPDGAAKVTDFGLAKAMRPEEDMPAGVSFAGMTPAYSSPEQADAAAGRAGVRITAASDVWSWGLTVLEMFAGRRTTTFGQAAGAALTVLLDEGLRIPDPVALLLRACFADDATRRPTAIEAAARLIDSYAEVAGTVYPRSRPKAARLLADGLCNQALSLLDLGRDEEAEELFRGAVTADPYHLPTVYNRALHSWRTGRIMGEEVVSDVEAAWAADPANGLGPLLLGAVQLERHEDERAGQLLREADQSAADVQTALAELANRPPRVNVDLEHPDVTAIALNADGSAVLFGDKAGRLVLWTPGKGTGRRALRTLTRRGDPVTAAAMSADATVGVIIRDDDVELWDLARGRQGQRLHDAIDDVGVIIRDGLAEAMRDSEQRGLRDSGVCAIAVSADGRFCATGHSSGRVSVWSVENGWPVADLLTQAGSVHSLALSPDGSRVVAAFFDSEDSSVRAWDVATQTLTAVLTGPQPDLPRGWPRPSNVDFGALSADAVHAVVAWRSGPCVTWDAHRDVVLGEVRSRRSDIDTVVLAGTTMLSNYGLPVRVWNALTGQCLGTLSRDLVSMSQLTDPAAISPDARTAAFWTTDSGVIALRSLPVTGYRAPWCYARPRAVDELVSTEDTFRSRMDRVRELTERERYAEAGALLRSVREVPGFARNREVRAAWATLGPRGTRANLLGGWRVFTFEGEVELTRPPVVALREDGRYMATCRSTCEVDLWDFRDSERLRTFDSGEGGAGTQVHFAADGVLLLVLTDVGTIRQLNLYDGSKRIFANDNGKLTALDVNPAGDRVVIGDEHGTVRQRELPSGKLLREIAAVDGQVSAVVMSPDGRHLAAVGLGTDIRVWGDRPAPKFVVESRNHYRALRFGPDGNLLFISLRESTAAWDVATGEFKYEVRGVDAHPEWRLALSGDGRFGATPARGGLAVWSADTGKVVRTLPMTSWVRAHALSADGTFAVTATADRHVQVWDLRTGECLRTMEAHEHDILRVMLSGDGRWLMTLDIGSTVCGWELVWDYDIP
ncbi:protein kinase domain-containing protein [Amycolatopsis sp. MEPSY49]|uniref:protein kinase domain-containing protein n=1 Tax=Amycolatopsis sp. MEPSY49 TaxID=3151600 RepID=UPI003EF488A1